MRAFFISIFITFLFFVNCTKKEPLILTGEEEQLINDTFLSIVGDKYIPKGFPYPPEEPIHPNQFSTLYKSAFGSGDDQKDLEIYDTNYEIYKQEMIFWDSLYAEIDMRELRPIIILDDTLRLFDSKYLNYTRPGITFGEFFSMDSSWVPLVFKLNDSLNTVAPFQISRITNSGIFSVLKENSDIDLYDLDNYNIKFSVSFSRVAFNSKGNRAVFYVSMYCGSLCGHGFIFFSEKKEGKWTIISERRLWIA